MPRTTFTADYHPADALKRKFFDCSEKWLNGEKRTADGTFRR